MRARSSDRTGSRAITHTLLAVSVLAMAACGGRDAPTGTDATGRSSTGPVTESTARSALRCDAPEAQSAIIKELALFDSDRVVQDIYERSVSDYMFYWTPEGEAYSNLEYNGWPVGSQSLAELEVFLAQDCPVEGPSDICTKLAENRRLLRSFADKIRGRLSNVVVTATDEATGESTCTAHVRFEATGIPDKVIEYALTYTARQDDDGQWQTRRLKPRSRWEQVREEQSAEASARARQYNHNGPFLKPGGLFCLSLNALPRAAAIETANNPYVQDPGPNCDFAGDEYTPLVEVTEVMLPSYVRAKVKSSGQYLWTTRKNLVSGIDGVAVVDPLLNDGKLPERRIVAEIPPALHGAGRCVSDGAPVTYDIASTRLRLGPRECDFESGASSGQDLYATMRCRLPDATATENHVGLFRAQDGRFDIRIAGVSLCTVPADGKVPDTVEAEATPVAEPAPPEAQALKEPASDAVAEEAPPVADEPTVIPPSAARITQPEYPPAARRKMEEGIVTLRIEVLPNGRAGAIAIERSSGSADLDSAAVKEVQRAWRFVPGTVDGSPTSQWTSMAVTFKLSR